jgi:hypothetical protein
VMRMSARRVRVAQQLEHPHPQPPESVEQIFKHNNSPVLEQTRHVPIASHPAGWREKQQQICYYWTLCGCGTTFVHALAAVSIDRNSTGDFFGILTLLAIRVKCFPACNGPYAPVVGPVTDTQTQGRPADDTHPQHRFVDMLP